MPPTLYAIKQAGLYWSGSAFQSSASRALWFASRAYAQACLVELRRDGCTGLVLVSLTERAYLGEVA